MFDQNSAEVRVAAVPGSGSGSREDPGMKAAREFVVSTLIGGVFIVVPVYLAIVLLLKGMQSVARLVRPFAAMLPDWLPAEGFLSLLLVLLLCFVVGAAVRTRAGRAVRERLEKTFFERLPGYSMLRRSDPAIGRERRGERVAAGAGRDRGRARPRLHHRRARGRPVHGVRARPFRRRWPVRSTSSAASACTGRRSVHSGDQHHLPMGVRVRRTRRGDARQLLGRATPLVAGVSGVAGAAPKDA